MAEEGSGEGFIGIENGSSATVWACDLDIFLLKTTSFAKKLWKLQSAIQNNGLQPRSGREDLAIGSQGKGDGSHHGQNLPDFVAIDADKAIRLVIPYLRATQIRNCSGIHRSNSGIGREYFFVSGYNLLNLHNLLFYELFTEKYVGFDGRRPGENLPMSL
jgi:hypothetical protein